MDPKSNDWCPYNKKERKICTDSEETHREVGHVVMETDTRVKQPLRKLEVIRKGVPAHRGAQPCQHLDGRLLASRAGGE